jgi:hypothetical protein
MICRLDHHMVLSVQSTIVSAACGLLVTDLAKRHIVRKVEVVAAITVLPGWIVVRQILFVMALFLVTAARGAAVVGALDLRRVSTTIGHIELKLIPFLAHGVGIASYGVVVDHQHD